jgi:hypothetical protein
MGQVRGPIGEKSLRDDVEKSNEQLLFVRRLSIISRLYAKKYLRLRRNPFVLVSDRSGFAGPDEAA